jgi:hypothetical protein
LGTDWKDQWQRVQRWHQQVSAIGAGEFPFNDVESYRPWAGDVIYAFFMNCFHLKDWLVGSGAATEDAVNAFIDASEAMRWCRDICHGMKHFRLDRSRPTTTHAVWSTAAASFSTAQYIGPSQPVQPLTTYRRREPVPGEHWYFLGQPYARDMFDLADDCMFEWRRFLGPSLKA